MKLMMYLLIAMAFSLNLTQNIDAIIVAKSTRHFIIVHGQVILLDAPQFRQTSGVNDFEDTGFTTFPGYEITVTLS